MLGIRLAKALSIKRLEFRCDSHLLVFYIRGEYKVKKERIAQYLTLAKSLIT